MMSDIPEGVEYAIDIIRIFQARNQRAVCVLEFDNRMVYLNYALRKFFLEEVFCVDEFMRPLEKESVYPIRGNELCYENWYFRVEKNKETNYCEMIMIVK